MVFYEHHTKLFNRIDAIIGANTLEFGYKGSFKILFDLTFVVFIACEGAVHNSTAGCFS
jgi:hypothetical protein